MLGLRHMKEKQSSRKKEIDLLDKSYSPVRSRVRDILGISIQHFHEKSPPPRPKRFWFVCFSPEKARLGGAVLPNAM